MPTLSVLSKHDQKEFDCPPILSAEARSFCFTLSKEVEKKITHLRTPTNKIGFLLQYAYFKACKRFFLVSRFREEDIHYAAKLLDIQISEVDLSTYKKKTPIDHQASILKLLDYRPFNNQVIQWLGKELELRMQRLTEPYQIFTELLQLLYNQRIEIPTYHRLVDLISQHYLSYENNLLSLIKYGLKPKDRKKLNDLLTIEKEQTLGFLGQLKIINQSIKPKAVQASARLFQKVSDYFNVLFRLIDSLKLSEHNCTYYATWVKKAKLSQLKQFSNKERTYLHLIAFFQHQFYSRQDSFVDILLKCVQSAKNTALNKLTEKDQLTRAERRAAVRHLTKTNRRYKDLIDEITEITKSTLLSDTDKIQKIMTSLEEHSQQQGEIEQKKIELFARSLDSLAKDKDYFDILESLSIKLQNRVNKIIKVLVFNHETSNKVLINAIEYFKEHNGEVDKKSPLEFLTKDEREAVLNNKKGFKPSLYKILLFMHVADAIKSGELNLKHYYRYLSIQEYLIDKDLWGKQKEELLKLTGLEHFAHFYEVIKKLRKQLDEKYHYVNQRLLEGRNPYLSIDEKDKVYLTTPPLEERETEYIAALLGQVGYIPILRVLFEVDHLTKFTQCFKHHAIKHVKGKPKPEVFFAGIIGLGCNIGLSKIAKISTGVQENTLLNTANWYFNHKNLLAANDSLVKMIHKLSLPNIFIKEKDKIHASSDGRKVNVGVDSLLASYSFKYFGKDKGVSVYTFIDERQALFHPLVMSSAEREAAYVIDGLQDNDVVKVAIHSTDTHGYSEIIFAATHFLDIAFAPRIKNINSQKLYAFSSGKTYKKRGYKILPSRTINQKLIEQYWEDILRFMVTLKLKKVTASQLFKRLSSYAKDNPLYKALKEFGRIIKSLFILTYYDDVILRQRIEKQLNRIELSNKFSNAVFYANDGEFKQATKEEQEISTLCKVIIQNAIVLWNYLYLSQLLANCIDDKEQDNILFLIKDGSIITWRHINLHGEFDFTKHIGNSFLFDMKKILFLKIAQPPAGG
ncbi:MAG: Tn3 family transposase [Candidatus Paracaedibacteraceae bacterium]|nr:Tn3 family transposase [Candidatus Paracaedibacteraceae bacterium]